MDPLAALGLAANVAQFIEFGVSILQDARAISASGSTVSNEYLSKLATDLSGITATLQQAGAASASLSSEETELCVLAGHCAVVAADLSSCLNSISKQSKKKAVWDTVLKALQTRWSKTRIDELVARLSDFRGQLTLRLLLVLNTQQRQKKDGITALRDEIVEVISINLQRLESTVNKHSYETVAAIFETIDGNSRAISARKPLRSSSDGLDWGQAPSMCSSITFSNKRAESMDDASEGTPHFTSRRVDVSYEDTILDALHFRGIAERYSTIPQAHRQTFEWIWNDDATDDSILDTARPPRWSHLGNWLSSDLIAPGKCYWVSGKAGSGKSSLLKFLKDHPQTLRYLKQWAGPHDLIIGSFFFWYAGSDLQKSQEGLLRSLLMSVLSKRRYMIPLVFPDICRSLISGEPLSSRPKISHNELNAALLRLVDDIPQDLKVCFLLDGLDEFTGNHNELCDLVLTLSRSSSVKIVASSRPIPACVSCFEDCPRLRLQDLTRNDIRQFVWDNFGSHDLMKRLEASQHGITTTLVNRITSHAQGVFLWVVLVVKKLVLGLQNYDTSSELLEEIDRLPPDLEKLYDHMLGSMSESKRVLGAKFLQLVLRSTEISQTYPLTLLQLSFAEGPDYEQCIDAPVVALTSDECSWRCEATEGRLRSRCCGLLETQDSSFEMGHSAGDRRVTFLHRSVKEFLQHDFVWNKVSSLTSGSNFDVDMALLSSSVSELKAMPFSPSNGHPSPSLMRLARMVTYGEALNKRRLQVFHMKYLPALRFTLAHHWHNATSFRSPSEEAATVQSSSTRAQRRLRLEYPQSLIVSLSMQAKEPVVFDIIFEALGIDERQQQQCVANSLIQYVEEDQTSVQTSIANSIGFFRWDADRRITVAEHTRKQWNGRWRQAGHGQGVGDREYRDWSTSEFMLHHCFSITNNTESPSFDFGNEDMSIALLTAVLSVLRSGASAQTLITLDSRRKTRSSLQRRTLSALSVIRPVLYRIWASVHDSKPSRLDEIANLSTWIEQHLVSGGGEELDEEVVVNQGVYARRPARTDQAMGSNKVNGKSSRARDKGKSPQVERHQSHRRTNPTADSGTASTALPSPPRQESDHQSPWYDYIKRKECDGMRESKRATAHTLNRDDQGLTQAKHQSQAPRQSPRANLFDLQEKQLVTGRAKDRRTTQRGRRDQAHGTRAERQQNIADSVDLMQDDQPDFSA